MVTTVVIGMLCVHLLCFSLMFLLISRRLLGKKMGMDVFALGNLMLGLAYVLQLFGGHANGSVMSIVNHTLTLCAPVTYVLGGLRFFDYPIRIWRPLLGTAVGYTTVQILVQVLLGTEARHAMLAGSCAALFLAMTVAALYVGTTLARDLRVEMGVFAVLIGGICALNAAGKSMCRSRVSVSSGRRLKRPAKAKKRRVCPSPMVLNSKRCAPLSPRAALIDWRTKTQTL